MIREVAVIGLGNIGARLSTGLAGRYRVAGFDTAPERREAVRASGVTPVERLADLAGSEVIMLSLPAPDVSRRVAGELAGVARPGCLLIETSTVTPEDMAALAGLCAPAGIRALDAAIHGGVGNVTSGDFAWLVGGDAADVERARPLLATLSTDILHLGPLGAGMAAKVINNAVVHAVMVAIVEGAALAAGAGLSMATLHDLLRRETGLARPLTHRFQERVRRGDYEGGMSAVNARKDSALALRMAADQGTPLFTIPAAHTVYEIAVREGLGQLDYAAIACLWEAWLSLGLSDQFMATTEPSGPEEPR